MEINVSKKEWTFQKSVMLLLMVAGPIFNVVMLIKYADIDNFHPLWIHNVSVDTFGSIIALLLFVSCIKNRDEQTGMGMIFSYILFNNSVLFFFDFVRWAVDGVPRYAHVNIVFNEMYLIASLWLMNLFWHYLVEITLPDDPKLRKGTRIVNIISIFAIFTVLGNYFWGYYFRIDPQTGLLVEGKYLSAIGIYTMILLFMGGAFILAYPFDKQKKKILFSYISFPLLATIYQMFHEELSIVPGAVLCATTLIFANVFAERNEEAAKQELELQKKEMDLLSLQRDHARLDTELDMAKKIQASMLPCIFPAFPHRPEFDIYAKMTPAKEVGGDFYDFFMLDEDHLVMVMGDVSGKGVPAALFMMAAKIMIKNLYQANKDFQPSKVLGLVNNMLLENNEIELFVTVWLANYEISTGKLTYANAGHEDPAISKKGSFYSLHKTRHGFVLAGMEDMAYRDYEMTLDVGDRLFIYTDGVTEAMNGSKELWGTDRMLEALDKTLTMSMQETIETVQKEINLFIEEEEQFDDITMLALEIIGR